MKIVILAGGFGTRISEESQYKPKPMIEIGGMPIIWHIMKEYSFYGYNEFIICAGYKQNVIKEWFSHYFLFNSDVTFDYTNGNEVVIKNKSSEPWKVTIVDTGIHTQTGGRIKRIHEYVGDETFMLTYGDAVSDLNIAELEKYHFYHGKAVTISSYNYAQNKGVMDIGIDKTVHSLREKSHVDGEMINIGYMVLNSVIFDYIKSDNDILEKDVLSKLVNEGQAVAYIHSGFWQCMDTLREKNKLEELWESKEAPWCLW